jgi:hypothetical protein
MSSSYSRLERTDVRSGGPANDVVGVPFLVGVTRNAGVNDELVLYHQLHMQTFPTRELRTVPCLVSYNSSQHIEYAVGSGEEHVRHRDTSQCPCTR